MAEGPKERPTTIYVSLLWAFGPHGLLIIPKWCNKEMVWGNGMIICTCRLNVLVIVLLIHQKLPLLVRIFSTLMTICLA